MRILAAVIVALLPSRIQRIAGRWLFGWQIDRSAHLGHSLILVDRFVMAPGCRIGSGNVIKGLVELRLDEGAAIHSFNWISGQPLSSGHFVNSPRRRPALVMGRHSGLTTRHLIDCSDTVRLGDFAVLGGQRTTVLTHSVNLLKNRSMTAAVEIGERAVVLGGCQILAGIRVAPRSIISAGSVVTTPLTQELMLYRGNPAEPVRPLSPDLGIFHRQSLSADCTD